MPTEELFGAYNVALSGAGASRDRVARTFKAAGINISQAGLNQAVSGKIVSNPIDRAAIAKMLVAGAKNSVARAGKR